MPIRSFQPLRIATIILPSIVLLLFPLRLLADAPAGYYDSAAGMTGSALHQALHNIIKDHTRYPYTDTSTDTWDILEAAHEDPDNSSNILDVYKNESYPKTDHTNWNREHCWPKSYGFYVDGSCNYPYTDCHHLIASNEGYNSARGNRVLANCPSGCTQYPITGFPTMANWGQGSGSTGSWEVWPNRRGDVARALFYMDVRYEGGTHGVTGCPEPDLILTDNRDLIVSNTSSNYSPAYMGLLSTLLQWHIEDPVDDRERAKNDIVYSFQGNRNPFVDHPEWVCEIWGGVACTGLPTPTTLSAGDIVILGLNSDTGTKGFAWAPLVPIVATTHVVFTDSGWYAAGGFRANEGCLVWTAPTDIAAGTVLTYYSDTGATSGDYVRNDSYGCGSGGLNFSTSGDQLLVFQGPASSPTFITAMDNNAADYAWDADCTSANNSAIPSGLVNGTTAFAIRHYDNWQYTGPRGQSTPAAVRADVFNTANWTYNDTAPFTFNTTSFSSVPVGLDWFIVE